MSKLFKINDKDNVAVALEELKKGEIIDNIKLLDDIPFGHKVLLNGYLRQDGRAATRNEIWIIPTVGCVNNTAKRLEKIGQDIIGDGCDGLFVYTHHSIAVSSVQACRQLK